MHWQRSLTRARAMLDAARASFTTANNPQGLEAVSKLARAQRWQ